MNKLGKELAFYAMLGGMIGEMSRGKNGFSYADNNNICVKCKKEYDKPLQSIYEEIYLCPDCDAENREETEEQI